MAKTAVVNKRRRRKNPAPRSSNRRRRRNYGAAATVNRRRKRRRNYGAAATVNRRRRRRNPISPYASASYYRRPNPMSFSMDEITEVVPAATAGVMGARFALKQAGAFEPDSKGVLVPGVKHAVALYLGAMLTGQLVGQLFGGDDKGRMARIAALGWAGDLFVTRRFFRDSDFVKNNFSLQGVDDGEYYAPELAGFQAQSRLGETMVDAFGTTYQATADGWQPMSGVGDYVVGEDGMVYELSGGPSPGGARLDGFANSSPLAGVRPSSDSSFGYSR